MASENLTDQRVRTVTAPKGQRLEIRDTKQAGLVLRLSEAGVKTWSVLYRRKIDGKRRRVTLGEYPQVTLAQARDQALDVLARVAKREDPAADHRRGTTGRPRTFQELADNYLENHAEPNKRSARIDRQVLAKDVTPLIGGEPLESIKPKFLGK